ncbi:hypothetical protein GCM10027345_18520 [Hymenobacter daeguensis]
MLLLLTAGLPARAQTEATRQAAELATQTRQQWAGAAIATADFRISSAYTEPSGLLYAYPQQLHAGIPVYNQVTTLVFKANALRHHTGSFLTDKAFAGQPATPALTAAAAVARALASTKAKAVEQPAAMSAAVGVEQLQTFAPAGVARRPIEVRLVWATDKGAPRLAWNVNVELLATPDWLNIRVDAATGQVLGQDNWTANEAFSRKAAAPRAGARPQGQALRRPVAPGSILTVTPARYVVVPFPGERPDVTLPALDINPWLRAGAGNAAATHGWHFDGTTNYTDTRGNNVWAYDDSLKLNAPGRFATSTGTTSNLIFNYVPDFTKVPTLGKNRRAATVNLFYWNNLMHDVLYQYGFTEAAGNFQTDNIGRGGAGNDYVKAEAQDGGGTNNANFSTPPDGTSGRMQMYLFTLTSPGRDGDFDSGVITHEYGHGVSNRLTGGPANASCLGNAEEGGEGWSDYFSLMMTTNWTTATTADGTAARPIGTYVLGQSPTAAGIRRYPYSTNMSIDPLTYANVATSPEVHNIGEVWCSALWDMTWAIIQQQNAIAPDLYNSASTGGNNVALQLVMQGLKLQPCQPGFLDARDAILAADSLLYNGRYHCAIWNAFARRGMGVSARQGLSTNATDQTPAFDTPTIQLTKNTTPLVGNQFNLSITATCGCATPPVNITDQLPADLQYLSSTGGTLAGSTVTFANQVFAVGQTRTYQIQARTAPGKGCAVTNPINDDRDANTAGGLTAAVVTGANSWASSTTRAFSATHSWKAGDPASTSDVTLTSAPFTVSGFTNLSFYHYYNTESRYDGGMVAISANGGPWVDAAPYFTQNGYNTTFNSSTASAGKPCFSGLSSTATGAAAFQRSVLNLSSFTGQSIQVRFQLQSDVSVAGEGWYLDDIVVQNGCGDYQLVKALNGATVLDSYSQAIFLLPPPPIPTITSFTPGSGPVGTSVIITGTNFIAPATVSFNGTAATGVVINSATQITVPVPVGATTGPIVINTAAGTATSTTSFHVLPTVAITSPAGASGGSTSTSPFAVTVTFSQAVTGFGASDVVLTNGALSSFAGSGTTYTFNVTPAGNGLVTVNIPANAAQNSTADGNVAALPFSLTYTQGITAAPVLTAPANGSLLNTATPSYLGTAPAGSTVTVYVDNVSIGTTTAAGGTFGLTQPAALGQGPHTVRATAQSSGLAVSASSNTNSFTVDTVAPTVTISSAAPNPTSTSPIPVTVLFSEAVTGFVAGDVTVTNGTVANFGGSGGSYSFQVVPAAAGPVVVLIVANMATDAAGNGNAASLPYTHVYAPVASANIRVLYQNGNPALPTDNSGQPNLQLINDGTAAVPLAELTVRYWLTVENFAPVDASVNWAQLGTSLVQAHYVPLATPLQGAFGYLEYAFLPGAGSLAAGANSGVILSSFNKQNWTSFDEADDYSFGLNSTYQPTTRITVYRNGALVGGQEPAPAPVVTTLKVYAQNLENAAITQSIATLAQVGNEGNLPVAYSALSVRYWFTPDGSSPIVSNVNYAAMNRTNLSISLGQQGTEKYAELSFSPGLGLLAPHSSTGDIIFRLNELNWSFFDQSKDYSFRPAAPLAEHPQMTAYLNGQLVYGTEPAGAQSLAGDQGPTKGAGAEATLFLQGYPSPFTTDVRLDFTLPQDGTYTLDAYDALGRVVEHLASGSAGAGLLQHVQWEARDRATGLYLIRLTTATGVKQLRLLKQ